VSINDITLEILAKPNSRSVFDANNKKQNDIALALIEKGANINATVVDTSEFSSVTSLLQIAIQREKIDIALKLIERGADFDHKILKCVFNNYWNEQQEDALNLLKKIFEKKPLFLDLINTLSDSTYPLLVACEKHNYLMVEYLLHSEDIPEYKRADPNKIQGGYRYLDSAITLACYSFEVDSSIKLKMIESLKRAGADLKFKDQEGFDLCRYAIKIKGSSQFFEEIYNNRSPIEKIRNIYSGRNKKLLEIATKEGNLECVSFLYNKLSPQSQGCSPLSCLTISNKELENLFHTALAYNRFEVAKFFIEKDGNIIDSNNKNGDREIETSLNEFLETSGEDFMGLYRFQMSEAVKDGREMDIANISLGKKIKFLVENNCEISEKFNQILTNFRLQNLDLNPHSLDDNVTAIQKKLEFLEKIENLIQSRSPNPLSTSASAQVVRAQGPEATLN
jgi:ankyrin repeat protein